MFKKEIATKEAGKPTRLNVLHIASSASTRSQNTAAHLCTEIQKEGHKSTVLTLNVAVKNIFLVNILQAFVIYKAARKAHVTLIHLHSLEHLLPLFLIAFLPRAPKGVCSFRTDAPTLSWWQKQALKKLSLAITPSTQPTFLPKKIKTQPTPFSIDAQAFANTTTPTEVDNLWAEWDVPSATKVIYIPTEEPTAALKNFINTLKDVNQMNEGKQAATFKLIVTGDYTTHPKAFSPLWQHIEKAGLNKHILFIGTPKNEAAVYNAADLILITQSHAFHAEAALKAQAMGKPIIAPQTLAHLFQEGQTGWAFNPTAPQTLTHPLKRALADQAALYRMGKACTQYVKKTHTAMQTVATTLAFYKKAMGTATKTPNKTAFIWVALLSLSLSACAENFSWQNPKTWHFRLSEEARKQRDLKNACAAPTTQQERRVILMDGVADRIEHTECHPHTTRPLTPQRFEGR